MQLYMPQAYSPADIHGRGLRDHGVAYPGRLKIVDLHLYGKRLGFAGMGGHCQGLIREGKQHRPMGPRLSVAIVFSNNKAHPSIRVANFLDLYAEKACKGVSSHYFCCIFQRIGCVVDRLVIFGFQRTSPSFADQTRTTPPLSLFLACGLFRFLHTLLANKLVVLSRYCQEVPQQRAAVWFRRQPIFRMGLNSIGRTSWMPYDLISTQIVFRQCNKAFRKTLYLVIVVLHQIEAFPHTPEKGVVLQDIHVASAPLSGIMPIRKTIVFASSYGSDLAAKREGKRLVAAANPENRNLKLINNDLERSKEILEICSRLSSILTPWNPVGTQRDKGGPNAGDVFNGGFFVWDNNAVAFSAGPYQFIPYYNGLFGSGARKKVDHYPCGRYAEWTFGDELTCLLRSRRLILPQTQGSAQRKKTACQD